MNKKHSSETAKVAKELVQTILGGASELTQSNATFHLIGLLRAVRDDKPDLAQIETKLLKQVIRREMIKVK